MMKKLCLRANGFELIEQPMPRVCEPLDAVIKVSSVVLNLSDTSQALLGDKHTANTIGQAACGEIIELGSEVKSLALHDRVVISARMPCFICVNCLRGFTTNCLRFTSTNPVVGTASEYVYVHNAEANAARVPIDISDECACYAPQIVSSAMQAAETTCLPIGGQVAVLGLDPFGLMSIVSANLSCASVVIAIGTDQTNQQQLRCATELGADLVLGANEDVTRRILEQTEGVGVDAVINFSSNSESLSTAISITREGGIVCTQRAFVESAPKEPLFSTLQTKQLNLKHVDVKLGRERIARMLRLIDTGRIDPRKLTTHHLHITELKRLNALLVDSQNGHENVCMVLINFDTKNPSHSAR